MRCIAGTVEWRQNGLGATYEHSVFEVNSAESLSDKAFTVQRKG